MVSVNDALGGQDGCDSSTALALTGDQGVRNQEQPRGLSWSSQQIPARMACDMPWVSSPFCIFRRGQPSRVAKKLPLRLVDLSDLSLVSTTSHRLLQLNSLGQLRCHGSSSDATPGNSWGSQRPGVGGI
ncbi:hypothetical protein RRG08_062325 [Elysia crispata]|uniref:Uncharacterized protein n=1 Tax=Elysia crispata TaxID=231223 RepID=A0AAE0YHX8_9GAST|nr:hypothetical protein RRG08_062325 [Elysia crispata]